MKILPVTVLNSNGEGQDSDVIAGVIWAADHGADVILMAFSNPGFSPNLQDAIDYAWSKNVVVVAAVGNNASAEPTFPAGDRGVMGVAATDQADGLASFSNEGQAVFIAAPGVDIQTTDLGDAYTVISGTSTSAAIVAGAAALMKAVDPTLTNGIIVGRLARNADPGGTQTETGNGRMNVARAMSDTSVEAVQPAGAAPVGNGGPFVGPYQAAARNFNIEFAGTGGGQVQISVNVGLLSFGTTGANRCDTPPASGTGNNSTAVTISGTCNSLSSSNNGALVTVTAVPNSGSFFTGWTAPSGGFVACTLNNITCSQVLGGNSGLTVNFSPRVNTTTVASNASALYGATSVTLSATVTPASGPAVNEGTVTFTVKKNTTTIGSVTSGTVTAGSASASFGLSGVNADTYTIEAVYDPAAANPKFNQSNDLTKTLTVNKITVTVTPDAGQFKNYGAADPTFTYTFTPALVGTDTFLGALARDPGESVGLYNITQGTLALSANYTLVFTPAVKFEIKKLTITVTPNSGQFKDYGATDPTLTYTFTPALVGTDSFSGALARDPGETVALYNITQGTLALGGNYMLVFTTGVKFEIKKLTVTVTPTAGQFKNYGAADPTLTYGFTPALVGSDSFSGALARDPGESVGLYNITQGTLSLSANYTLVFTSGVKFEIKKLTVTVTPTAGQFKNYGATDPTLTYTFTPALVGTDSFSGALARDPGENAGLYNITQGTLTLGGNYTLVFTSGVKFEIKKLTITVTPNNGQYKVYGNADPTLTYSFAPALIGSDTFTGSLARATGEDVGLYDITQGTLALSTNYALVFTVGVKFEIKKKNITVTPNAGQYKTYGDADPTLTYGFSPALVGTDTFTGALARVAGENVGLYDITQGTLALSSNYNLIFTAGVQFEIKKKNITVTPNAGQYKTYGDADPTLTYGFSPALVGTDTFTGALPRVAGENVGLYDIIQGTLSLSGNYNLIFTTGVTFEIKKKTITVTPNSGQYKTYGSADPVLTYGFFPALIGTDTFSGSLGRTAGENAGLYDIIQGTLALSSNYTLVFTSGVTFEIRKLTITVTPTTGQYKIYGSADPTLTYAFAPALIGTDTFSGALARTAGENVGLYDIIQGSLALSGNYNLVFTAGVKFEIKKLTIAVTPTSGQYKIYGNADPTLTYGFAPALIGTDTFTGALARVAGENVGLYDIVQGSLTLSGNYNLVFTAGVKFEIKKLTIAVTPTSGQYKIYGSADPTLTYAFAPGLIGTDIFSGALARTAGENVGLYDIVQGSLTLSGNYTLVFTAAVKFEIKKKNITVTPTAGQYKIYGGTDPNLTYGFSPALVETDTFAGALARIAGENAGLYDITQGSLILSGNYNLIFTSGVKFEIRKKNASVTPDNNGKLLGSADPVPLTTGTLTGFLTADGVTATYSRVPGEIVGSYVISATLSPAAALGNYNITYNTALFTIIYNWTGFFQPIDNPETNVINRVKAGQAIPIKFSLHGNQGMAIFMAGYPQSGVMACGFTGDISDILETVNAGGSSLSYDAGTDQYIYVWKTDRAWAGTCRQLVVRLADGTYHRANFTFTK